MTLQKFVLEQDVQTLGFLLKAGDVVVESHVYDYGLAGDDSMFSGVEHWSVSYDLVDGGYPTYSVPKHLLKEV